MMHALHISTHLYINSNGKIIDQQTSEQTRTRLRKKQLYDVQEKGSYKIRQLL